MRAERESAARDLRRSISRSFALHLAVRVIEAAAIGWLAACVVLALVTWTMPAAAGLHGALAAGIAGAAAAGALWIERTPRLHDHVRRADRRLGLDGALITARDVSAEAEPASLAGALVERVRARTGRFGLARASLPSTPLALVAVLLGTTLLLASHDDAARHGGNSTDVANIDARAEALASAAAALSTASARLRAADGLESGILERVIQALGLWQRIGTQRLACRFSATAPALE